MKLPLTALLFLFPLGIAFAETWPNYRGPNYDGTTAETVKTSWSGTPEETLWRVDTPLGFSSFAVGQEMALTLVEEEIEGNPMEVVVALDRKSGEEVWKTGLWLAGGYDKGGAAGAKDNSGGDGPRSTPAIHGDKVYVIDSHLRVYCLSLADGEIQWKHDVLKENSGSNIKWQNAASALVDGDLVFVAGGGRGQALIALNKDSGDVVWKAENDAMTHATPIVCDLLGTRQVIFFTQEGLVALSTTEGEELWRYDFPFNVSTAASPVVWEDIVYCSAGYGVGAGAVKVTKDGDDFEATEIWRTENENINHWSTPVAKDGYLYGMFSFKKYGEGPLACVDIRTGEMKWSEEGYGPGNVILAGDNLLALSDSGDLVLVEAKPDGYTELTRASVLEGKCWSTPALADGVVYVRSTQEGAALKLGE